MARNQHAGPSTLRNRNRVTNKTRLKVIKESIDADPIVLDEDEEKARVVSTAGVDAEDANEHHLQAVLSAAATRHQAVGRSTRTGPEKELPNSTAYIPTPDSTGKVDNYEELYPPNRWLDPVTYVKSSETNGEATTFSLSGGYIYYMDERDQEWLEKNNEEARGEGTSAQGAISGTSTRSGRSAKSKGKDPEMTPAVSMTEDEFELVMAIFEKITHEKTEFLHHGLDQGAPFPPFSDYQDTFSAPLPATLFSLYTVPTWIPEVAQMLRYAKTVYPYWRERRIERNGHPIIPIVNLDETDTKNESYICFRRRESKAVRKTRTQQATYSDKMVRLQSELATAMELAKGVLQREGLKKEHTLHTKLTWERRFALADLKRKFPALGNPGDEELFQDREKPPKRAKTDASGRSIKVRPPMGESGLPIALEPMMRPKDRHAMIQSQIDLDLAKRKEKDHGWDDAVDNPYQPSPVPYASRLFKVISASRSSSSNQSSNAKRPERQPRAVRMRVGRGGRPFLDRRDFGRRSISSRLSESSEDEAEADRDLRKRLAERWRFDDDDGPAIGPEGSDEQDRELVDDYDSSYLRFQMTLLKDQDIDEMLMESMQTLHSYMPFASQRSSVRRDYQRPGGPMISAPGMVGIRHPSGSLASPNGTNSAVPPPIKNMPPPVAVPQMRISSGGGIRPPGTPVVPALPQQSQQSSPTQHSSQTPTVNGISTQDNSNGTVAEQEGKTTSVSASHTPTETNGQPDSQPVTTVPISSPVRKSQTPTMTAIPNGFTVPSINNYNIANSTFLHHPGRNGLSTQQIKSAFANLPTNPDGTIQTNGAHVPMRTPPTYMGHTIPASNYNAQMVAARQMQWAAAVAVQQQQQQQARVNGTATDGNGTEANVAAATLSPQGVPARVPSANGQRPIPMNRAVPNAPALAQALSVAQGRASPANGHIARLTPHSPSSHMLTPVMSAAQPHSSPPRPAQPPMPSPSLQSRQAVGSSGAGY